MARDFNGSSDFARKSSGSPVTGFPFSASMFAYFDSPSTTNSNLLSISVGSGVTSVAALWQNGLGLLSAQYYDGSTEAQATIAAPSSGAWKHVGGVWSGNASRTVYLDGSSSTDTASLSAPATFDSVAIGYAPWAGPGQYWDGKVAEFALWSVALDATDMAALRSGYSPLLVRSSSLVMYVPLIGRTSPEIDVRQGNSMTLTGTAQFSHPRVIYPRRKQVFTPPAAAAGVFTPYYYREHIARYAG